MSCRASTTPFRSAIVAGTTYACARDGDVIVLALAADHVVNDVAAFGKLCAVARSAAAGDRIVTFGVRPTRPATEYGYISAGAAVDSDVFMIERFVEKPDVETAKQYVSDGYFWNSGNFVFRARFLLEEYRRFEPESNAAVHRSGRAGRSRFGFMTLEPEAFARATPNQSTTR